MIVNCECCGELASKLFLVVFNDPEDNPDKACPVCVSTWFIEIPEHIKSVNLIG